MKTFPDLTQDMALSYLLCQVMIKKYIFLSAFHSSWDKPHGFQPSFPSSAISPAPKLISQEQTPILKPGWRIPESLTYVLIINLVQGSVCSHAKRLSLHLLLTESLGKNPTCKSTYLKYYFLTFIFFCNLGYDCKKRRMYNISVRKSWKHSRIHGFISNEQFSMALERKTKENTLWTPIKFKVRV